MSVEQLDDLDIHTVAGTGPYAVSFSFSDPAHVVLRVIGPAGTSALVDPADWSLEPTGAIPGGWSGGSITLSAEAAAGLEGQALRPERASRLEQGWHASTNPREAALASQLDWMARSQQEAALDGARSLRAIDPLPPFTALPGRVIAFDAESRPYSGPTIDEVANAQTYAEAAQAAEDQARRWAEGDTSPDPEDPDSRSSKAWAGLSQDWAEGSEPGGEGTKSAREHAEDAGAIAGTLGDLAELTLLAETTHLAAASVGSFTAPTLEAAIAEALSVTTLGQSFHASGSDVDYIGLYLHVSGPEAELVGRYPKTEYIDKVTRDALRFTGLPELRADTSLVYSAPGAGQIAVAPGNLFWCGDRLVRVAASGAIDHHLITDGGAKIHDLGYARDARPWTARLRAELRRGTRDVNVLVLSDSTANNLNEWPRRLLQLLSAQYPTHGIAYNFWFDDGSRYDPADVELPETGTGPHKLVLFNGSVPGFQADDFAGARFGDGVLATAPDLIITSYGHNGGTLEQIGGQMTALLDRLRAELPDVPVIVLAQNPLNSEYDQPAKAGLMRSLAGRNGHGFIDLHLAFTEASDLASLMADATHPNATGSWFTAWLILGAFFGDVAGGPVPVPQRVTKAQVGLPNVNDVSAAELRDRAGHTGEQEIITITGLQPALDGKGDLDGAGFLRADQLNLDIRTPSRPTLYFDDDIFDGATVHVDEAGDIIGLAPQSGLVRIERQIADQAASSSRWTLAFGRDFQASIVVVTTHDDYVLAQDTANAAAVRDKPVPPLSTALLASSAIGYADEAAAWRADLDLNGTPAEHADNTPPVTLITDPAIMKTYLPMVNRMVPVITQCQGSGRVYRDHYGHNGPLGTNPEHTGFDMFHYIEFTEDFADGGIDPPAADDVTWHPVCIIHYAASDDALVQDGQFFYTHQGYLVFSLAVKLGSLRQTNRAFVILNPDTGTPPDLDAETPGTFVFGSQTHFGYGFSFQPHVEGSEQRFCMSGFPASSFPRAIDRIPRYCRLRIHEARVGGVVTDVRAYAQTLSEFPPMPEPGEEDFPEPTVVPVGGDELMALQRGLTGTFERRSHDGGRTWTDAVPAYTERKHESARSKVVLCRSPSGRLVWVFNLSGTRLNMAFMLSWEGAAGDDDDDWKAPIVIDARPRPLKTYPSVVFLRDRLGRYQGKFLIAYDNGRSKTWVGMGGPEVEAGTPGSTTWNELVTTLVDEEAADRGDLDCYVRYTTNPGVALPE